MKEIRHIRTHTMYLVKQQKNLSKLNFFFFLFFICYSLSQNVKKIFLHDLPVNEPFNPFLFYLANKTKKEIENTEKKCHKEKRKTKKHISQVNNKKKQKKSTFHLRL